MNLVQLSITVPWVSMFMGELWSANTVSDVITLDPRFQVWNTEKETKYLPPPPLPCKWPTSESNMGGKSRSDNRTQTGGYTNSLRAIFHRLSSTHSSRRSPQNHLPVLDELQNIKLTTLLSPICHVSIDMMSVFFYNGRFFFSPLLECREETHLLNMVEKICKILDDLLW